MKLHDIVITKPRKDLTLGDRVEIRAKAYTPHLVGKIGIITQHHNGLRYVTLDGETAQNPNGYFGNELRPL